MRPDADSFSVGQSSPTLLLNSPAKVNHVIQELFHQARRCLYIRAVRLEFAFFQSEELLQAITTLINGNLRNRVHFLVDDELHFKSSQTRIIHLARTFSSYIKVHKLLDDQNSDREFFIVADQVAYVYQTSSHNYPVSAAAYAPAKAKELELKFRDCWARSEQIGELFTLGL